MNFWFITYLPGYNDFIASPLVKRHIIYYRWMTAKPCSYLPQMITDFRLFLRQTECTRFQHLDRLGNVTSKGYMVRIHRIFCVVMLFLQLNRVFPLFAFLFSIDCTESYLPHMYMKTKFNSQWLHMIKMPCLIHLILTTSVKIILPEEVSSDECHIISVTCLCSYCPTSLQKDFIESSEFTDTNN